MDILASRGLVRNVNSIQLYHLVLLVISVLIIASGFLHLVCVGVTFSPPPPPNSIRGCSRVLFFRSEVWTCPLSFTGREHWGPVCVRERHGLLQRSADFVLAVLLVLVRARYTARSQRNANTDDGSYRLRKMIFVFWSIHAAYFLFFQLGRIIIYGFQILALVLRPEETLRISYLPQLSWCTVSVLGHRVQSNPADSGFITHCSRSDTKNTKTICIQHFTFNSFTKFQQKTIISVVQNATNHTSHQWCHCTYCGNALTYFTLQHFCICYLSVLYKHCDIFYITTIFYVTFHIEIWTVRYSMLKYEVCTMFHIEIWNLRIPCWNMKCTMFHIKIWTVRYSMLNYIMCTMFHIEIWTVQYFMLKYEMYDISCWNMKYVRHSISKYGIYDIPCWNMKYELYDISCWNMKCTMFHVWFFTLYAILFTFRPLYVLSWLRSVYKCLFVFSFKHLCWVLDCLWENIWCWWKPYWFFWPIRHLVVTGHVPVSTITVFLKEFYNRDRDISDYFKIVILDEREPDEEMDRLLELYFNKLDYRRGSCMKVKDLNRVKVMDAEAVLFLADRTSMDADAEDAANIMRVVSIKNYKFNARVIVQLLQYHNKVAQDDQCRHVFFEIHCCATRECRILKL